MPTAPPAVRRLPDTLLVSLDQLHPNPANPRKTLGAEDELRELGASMLAQGCLQALLVVPRDAGGFQIKAGHRRHRAAQLVGIPALPCRVVQKLGAVRSAAVAAVENLQRRNLSPIEQAHAVRALIAADPVRGQAGAARQIGKSIAWVSTRLALLELPPEAQRLLQDGRMSAADGVELARKLRAANAGEVTNQACRPHFTSQHRLAGRARAACDQAGHPRRGRIGTVACGACWEATILACATAIPRSA